MCTHRLLLSRQLISIASSISSGFGGVAQFPHKIQIAHNNMATTYQNIYSALQSLKNKLLWPPWPHVVNHVPLILDQLTKGRCPPSSPPLSLFGSVHWSSPLSPQCSCMSQPKLLDYLHGFLSATLHPSTRNHPQSTNGVAGLNQIRHQHQWQERMLAELRMGLHKVMCDVTFSWPKTSEGRPRYSELGVVSAVHTSTALFMQALPFFNAMWASLTPSVVVSQWCRSSATGVAVERLSNQPT